MRALRAPFWLVLAIAAGIATHSFWATAARGPRPAKPKSAPTATAAAAQAPAVAGDGVSPEQKSEALKAFDDAMAAFAQKRFGDAVDGFRASYDLLPSPNSRLMIVRSLAELGQRADAYDEATAALADAEAAAQSQKKYEPTVKAIREEMADIRAKVGFVRVTVKGVAGARAPAPAPPEAGAQRGAPVQTGAVESESAGDVRLVVEGREIARSRWAEPLAADAGKVRIELFTAEGRATQEVEVSVGEQSSVEIEPAKPTAKSGVRGAEGESQGGNAQLLVPAAISGGIGVVGMVLFGVLGGLSDATYRDLEAECPSNNCPRELESDMTEARSQQTIGNVSVVIGAIGLTAGAVLFAFAEWDLVGLLGGGDDQSGTQAAITVGPGTVGIRGTF